MKKRNLLSIILLALVLFLTSIPCQPVEAQEMISQDKYDFELLINDQKFTLLSSVQDLIDLGFETDDDLSELELGSYRYTNVDFYLGKSKAGFTAKIANFTPNRINADQGLVYGLRLDSDSKYGVPFTLSGNITENSTLDEVKASFGLPTTVTTFDTGTTSLEYGIMENSYSLRFDQDNKLTNVRIEFSGNYRKDENSEETRQNVNKTGYKDKMRFALSEDLFDYTFYLDYNYIQLPVLVSDLMEDGWILAVKPVDTISSSTYESGFYLEKNNQFLKTSLFNPDANEQAVENCYVDTIAVSTHAHPYRQSCFVPLELSRGVVLGQTKKEDLITAYSDDYVLEESSKENVSTVTVSMPRKSSRYYEFIFVDDILARVNFSNSRFTEPYEPEVEIAPSYFVEGIEAILKDSNNSSSSANVEEETTETVTEEEVEENGVEVEEEEEKDEPELSDESIEKTDEAKSPNAKESRKLGAPIPVHNMKVFRSWANNPWLNGEKPRVNDSDEDSYYNTYKTSYCRDGGVKFLTNYNYAKIQGTIAFPRDAIFDTDEGYIEIYGDDELIFTSKKFNIETKAEEFEVDISKYEKVLMEWKGYYRHATLYDCVFIPFE